MSREAGVEREAPAASGWIALNERMPPEPCPKILVTNSIEARDAHGHAAHMWLVDMVHEPRGNHGFTAFLEDDSRVMFLTHWRYALPTEDPAHADLLAALEAMVAMHETGVVSLGTVRLARAALAKAKGLSPVQEKQK